MRRKLLFVIRSDPRISHRPAEAIRVAVGLKAAEHIEVRVYLAEAAVLVLSESVDNLIDEEVFHRFLPALTEAGQSVYVQQTTPFRAHIAGTPVAHEPLGLAELASVAAASDVVLHF